MLNNPLIRFLTLPALFLLLTTSCRKECNAPIYGQDGGGKKGGGGDSTITPVTTDTLSTGSGTTHYEMHYMGNDQTNYSDNTAPELDAATWTVGGIIFYVHGAFRFDLSSIPANTHVKTALLSLFTNYQPSNGDLIHANSGPQNAFTISRVAGFWEPATATWLNQPPLDATGSVLIPQADEPFLDVTNVDVTTMVNKMIDSGNYGFRLQLQNEVIYNSRIFYSSANPDPTKHPRLVITY